MKYHLCELLGPAILPLKKRDTSITVQPDAIKATKDKYHISYDAKNKIGIIDKYIRGQNATWIQ